jgi:uncharacterized membrane protein YvbJ
MILLNRILLKNMFCHSCGKQNNNASKFCHHCGLNTLTDSKVIPDTTVDEKTNPLNDTAEQNHARGKAMTKEEYMARTNIKSVDEAEGYLTRLKILFISVAVGMIITRGGVDSIDSEVYSIIWFF